jgi:hypothetical protein
VVEHVRAAPEVGEVLEGEVDRPGDRSGLAQLEQLAVLSLLSGHTGTVRRDR